MRRTRPTSSGDALGYIAGRKAAAGQRSAIATVAAIGEHERRAGRLPDEALEGLRPGADLLEQQPDDLPLFAELVEQ